MLAGRKILYSIRIISSFLLFMILSLVVSSIRIYQTGTDITYSLIFCRKLCRSTNISLAKHFWWKFVKFSLCSAPTNRLTAACLCFGLWFNCRTKNKNTTVPNMWLFMFCTTDRQKEKPTFYWHGQLFDM